MIASDAPFVDALASCLGAGVPLSDSLSRIEAAGAEASRWAQRVRSSGGGGDAGGGVSVEDALRSSQTIDGAEHALLAAAATADEVEGVLHSLALRCRRRDALRRAILRGMIGPFAIAALTVVLDPLPNLIGDGSYIGPVCRGLLELGLVTALVVAGVPAALRSPTLGPWLLARSTKVPGLAWLAARHAEAELVTISAPYVARRHAGTAGLLAASSMLAWSPLGEKIRGASLGGSAGSPPELDFALVRLAPHLSAATNLSIVAGIASGQLSARLVARGEEIASALTAHVRLGVRVMAYALVVLLSLQGLMNMFSRALPGGAFSPGGAPNAEQRELEEIMKELGGPAAPSRQK